MLKYFFSSFIFRQGIIRVLELTIDNGGETVNCQLSTVNLIHVDFDDDFDDSYYEQAAEQIYDNGGYNPEMLSTQKGSALINGTFRVFCPIKRQNVKYPLFVYFYFTIFTPKIINHL
jgi:hypothetical protein